jgi:WS/DGAT/MGAT family acyltransferase
MLTRLTAEDARILALESGAVVGHTCKVLVAERAGNTVAGLREQVAARIALAPTLRRRLAPTPLRLAAPAWVDDPSFDPSAHVVRAELGEPATPGRLREVVGALMAQRLDRSRPLWRVDVVDLEDDLVAVVWRVHHALADGAASLALANTVLWDSTPDPAPATGPALPAAPPLPGRSALAVAALGDHARSLARGVSEAGSALRSPARWRRAGRELTDARPTIRRELTRLPGQSPLDGDVGRTRRIAFVELDLDEVVSAAHSFGAVTVNDLVLTLVAGALRRWLEHRHADEAWTGPAPMRVQVPVSMHSPDDGVPNRDAFMNVELPVAEADPVARLLAVNGATRDLKAHHDADELFAIFAGLSHVSTRVYRRAYAAASNPRVYALSVSNVRGPAERRYLLGGAVHALYSLAEIAPRHALRISAWSYAGALTFGLCADAAMLPDLDVVADGLAESLDELRTHV